MPTASTPPSTLPAAHSLVRQAKLLPGGVPRWIRVYDSGVCDFARYCVVYTGRYAHKTGGEHWFRTMSANPYHAQGVGQMGYSTRVPDAHGTRWPPAVGRRHFNPAYGHRIRFEDLPPDCQRCVLDDYCYLWDLPWASSTSTTHAAAP